MAVGPQNGVLVTREQNDDRAEVQEVGVYLGRAADAGAQAWFPRTGCGLAVECVVIRS